MKIGILTSGGDCPGINATIRGVCKTAINHYGMEVYGIHSGFRGLLDNDIIPMDESSLTGLLNLGGTILGTSREKRSKRKVQLSRKTNLPSCCRLSATGNWIASCASEETGLRKRQPNWQKQESMLSVFLKPSTTTYGGPTLRSVLIQRYPSLPTLSTACTLQPAHISGSWSLR